MGIFGPKQITDEKAADELFHLIGNRTMSIHSEYEYTLKNIFHDEPHLSEKLAESKGPESTLNLVFLTNLYLLQALIQHNYGVDRANKIINIIMGKMLDIFLSGSGDLAAEYEQRTIRYYKHLAKEYSQSKGLSKTVPFTEDNLVYYFVNELKPKLGLQKDQLGAADVSFFQFGETFEKSTIEFNKYLAKKQLVS